MAFGCRWRSSWRSSRPARPPSLLRPRSDLIEPASVERESVLQPRRDRPGRATYRGPSAARPGAAWRSSVGTLTLIAVRPPRACWTRTRVPPDRAAPRRSARGLSLVLAVVALPLERDRPRRARDVGPLDAGLGRLAGRRRQVHGASTPCFAARARRRRDGADPALPATLVGRRGAGAIVAQRAARRAPRPSCIDPALQQVHAARRTAQLRSEVLDAGARAPTWTWARSTAWTRAAGPPARTPT